MSTQQLQHRASAFFRKLQSSICSTLEFVDGSARFHSDSWKRPDCAGGDGGGGVSCVLRGDGIFEQAGVNFSEVHGTLNPEMSSRLIGQNEPQPFFATGVSIVIHPRSPMIPTTHANYRYLEVGTSSWFGGGGDLTPYYLFREDAEHFHRTLRAPCEEFQTGLYNEFKLECDRYFHLPHRGEHRGIGGIFFDYLGRDGSPNAEHYFPLVQSVGNVFLDSYVPIVKRREREPWGERERSFQLVRRGRYVEFNLIYDRGTLFGLKTGGRTESILMSLPPVVRWEYDFQPARGSREAELLETLRSPQSWIS